MRNQEKRKARSDDHDLGYTADNSGTTTLAHLEVAMLSLGKTKSVALAPFTSPRNKWFVLSGKTNDVAPAHVSRHWRKNSGGI